MPVVRKITLVFQSNGEWVMTVEPEQGGSYVERFDRLQTAVDLLPFILRRFDDLTKPVEAEENSQ